MGKQQKYGRRMSATVGGETLKKFDEICVKQEWKESEGIKAALKLLADKYAPKQPPTNKVL